MVAASATVVAGDTFTNSVLITSPTFAMDSPPTREPSRRPSTGEPPAATRAAVLAWFAREDPDYPWRRTEHDPYAVWVSEVMLQQTQAGRVAEAFPRFLARFPTVGALAAATPADVIRAWAGMGYHRRAVALHRAAGIVVRDHDGVVPGRPADLRALPGIGPYTAAAIASIAFGVPVAAVDTNVHKVMARVEFGLDRQEVATRQAAEAAMGWLHRTRPGEWNQALMTLGRRVCRSKPRCEICPMAPVCRYPAAGTGGGPSVGRRQPFEGSLRQVRGRVVAALRVHPRLTVARLSTTVGSEPSKLTEAITGLVADGIVEATPAALAGRPRGRVRLPT
jgi:A/G-specific adenine glycosylase